MMLLLLVPMLLLFSGGSARVVQNFMTECGTSFANGRSPTTFSGAQYRQICQRLNNEDHFATFYDTDNKIPVYSAYQFKGIGHCTRKKSWYIEPQIADNNAGSNMASEGSVGINIRGDRQALNEDYFGSGYDKGHLAPVYHASSQSFADATFTLTNAAPQASCFNRVLWWDEEESLAEYLKWKCHLPHVYIVTGVVPGNKFINNRVNVPSYFWTAYCCLDQNNRCAVSHGAIGNNDNNSIIRQMSVAALEAELKNLYRKPFQLFQ